MNHRRIVLAAALILSVAGIASADTKIIQNVHQDEFTMMGQSQPATDGERVIWLGADRLRVDEGNSTFIVRVDSGVMYLIDHAQKTVSSVDIPVDVAALLPPGVAEQMRSMMQLEVEVSPTDETKKVGEWTARRWNLTMSTPMVAVDSTLWATKELDIDRAAYDRLFHQIVALQPGTEGLIERLRAVEGFVVEQRSVTTMKGAGDASMTRTEHTVSVEILDAPDGTYQPPADYSTREFDLMAALQGAG
jgi:hypothetical protein